jgi:hypothetical protein
MFAELMPLLAGRTVLITLAIRKISLFEFAWGSDVFPGNIFHPAEYGIPLH